jgi:3-keto-disaccharide hydrolase/TonB-dependent Receptor Plug Domain
VYSLGEMHNHISILFAFPLLLSLGTLVHSQQTLSTPHSAEPQDTEVWQPVPKVVVPGVDCGAPPSDAVVLFNGNNLDEWVSAKDKSTAKWIVAGGAMTVNKAEGDIETKRAFRNYQLHIEETRTLNLELQVGTVSESVQVDASTQQLQTESSALGHVTNSEMVENLPLVTRNYTQIVGLSPGVAADVTNAGSLGRGGGSDGSEAFVANGGSSMDNNFQMNGVEINDLQHSGFLSGGVAVPNPDTIQEFKVQTGQFDAAFGRNAGANVDVVTKGGSNQYHGTLFEFFRNEKLNANEYFRKLNDQPRQILRQNQFGFTFGGPIRKDKLFFFTSYQGTRQLNGVDANCSSTISTPPLTNDRSAAALGALFAGQTGLFGGTAILPDGSNIAPQALALLQRQLPDGSFLIPTPQRIDPTRDLEPMRSAFPANLQKSSS